MSNKPTTTTFTERSERLRQLRAEGKAGLSYEICIDEDQRQALLGILKGVMSEHTHAVPEALEYWIPMLEELPTIEEATPGITHGFCL